ncbi:MAG TPA: carboxypeptidase-like regulatory domain-containing protein, partial [Gemmatimonadales bacterium]|nr:carboxypeptidase-like regulatory domain-containing protein [Gemmatimonadales bacterium]
MSATRSKRAWVAALAVAGLAPILAAAPLVAQATITGRVTDTDGQPLGGAQVVVRELASFGANTASNGTYTIVIPEDRAKGQSMTLIARYLGKAPG